MSDLTTYIESASNFHHLMPAEASDVMAAETSLGLLFSVDFKEYLMAFGAATFDGRELTGICESERLSVVSSTIRAREQYSLFPSNAYVIEDLWFDNIFIFQDSSGKVYSYGPGNSNKLVAESLLDYLLPNCRSSEEK